GRRRGAGAGLGPRLGAGPALMALTGRVPLLVLLGLVPVVLRPSDGTVWLWLLAVLLLVAVDWLLAPRPAGLEVSRRPPGTVRLGDAAESVLVVHNAGSRAIRTVIRDAWQPSAG